MHDAVDDGHDADEDEYDANDDNSDAEDYADVDFDSNDTVLSNGEWHFNLCDSAG